MDEINSTALSCAVLDTVEFFYSEDENLCGQRVMHTEYTERMFMPKYGISNE